MILLIWMMNIADCLLWSLKSVRSQFLFGTGFYDMTVVFHKVGLSFRPKIERSHTLFFPKIGKSPTLWSATLWNTTVFKKDHEKPNSKVIFLGCTLSVARPLWENADTKGKNDTKGAILRAHLLYSNNFDWSNYFTCNVLQKFQHHFENFWALLIRILVDYK